MDKFSWLVGILEGEGCFFVDKRTGIPEIIIAMTDKDVMEKVSEYLDKSMIEQRTSGQVTHRVKITGRKALYVAEKVEPYMSQRRQQQISKMKLWSPKTTYKTEGYVPKPKRPIHLPIFD